MARRVRPVAPPPEEEIGTVGGAGLTPMDEEVVTPAAPSTAGIDELIASLGKGTSVLSDEGLSIHLPGVIPSGDEWLNQALGRGGWPLSRICLFGGDEGAGKTTLALEAVKSCQQIGGIAVYVDAEYKLDKAYAASLGVDVDRLLMPPPETGEDGEPVPMTVEKSFAFVESVIDRYLKTKSKVPVLIVYDSISALMTDQEAEGKDTPGTQARAYSKQLMKINVKVSRANVCLLLLSQMRMKIGVTFGAKDTTTGGKAPRFYSVIIAHAELVKQIKAGPSGKERRVGHTLRVEIVKNQVAPPFRKCEVDIRYGEGIDYVAGLHGVLKELGLIELKGSWTRFLGTEAGAPDEIRYQGVGGLRALRDESPADFQRLVDAVRATYAWMPPGGA